MPLSDASLPTDWLAEENLAQWRRHCPSARILHLPDKSFLYRQGEECPYVFMLGKGIVKISCLTEQGNEWTMALLRSGDILGRLQGQTGEKTMPETAQALGETAVVRLNLSEFVRLLSEQTALLWQVVGTQTARRQQAERKLIDMLAKPVEIRVLEMLKELAEWFGRRCAHGYALEIRLTQQELADLVGASRPVVSTVMNDLRSRNLLDYTRELICVKDDLFDYPDRPAPLFSG
jgi:CRP-like cAMP-binding protein